MQSKYIILLTILCVGCKNTERELQYLICKDSIQYWNYEWPRDRADKFGFTFSFDKEGNVLKYSYNKQTNRRSLFSDHPVLDPSMKWNVSADSIFNLMGSSKKIVKYNQDTIYAIDLRTKQKIFYVRVKEALNITRRIEINTYKTDSISGKKEKIEPFDI
tara:strand:- start:992 stop:1471 length:480 start_codon:yes stop_codon:yes gene_type:complete